MDILEYDTSDTELNKIDISEFELNKIDVSMNIDLEIVLSSDTGNEKERNDKNDL